MGKGSWLADEISPTVFNDVTAEIAEQHLEQNVSREWSIESLPILGCVVFQYDRRSSP